MVKKGKAKAIERARWSDHFAEWYTDLINEAGILDYRYNLKGCGVWLGFGFKLRKHILQIIRDLLDATPVPHEETLFPLLIPEDLFMKEAEHVKGFEDEVYWVTHGGLSPLDVKLALRPTSETVMYPMFALWIRSHQDLPLKVYQIVSTFRYEGKNTRPLIRVREITTFKEAHTAHATPEDAEKQIREAIEIYKAVFDALGLFYVVNQRPKWDTFPGAEYSIAFDAVFPGDHRALQIGTVHNLGTVFAKTFDIKYETAEGENEFVHQTCYGISERLVATVISQHGDDRGLVLPPRVAPVQVVVIPIVFKKQEERVLEACKAFHAELVARGLRARLDLSDKKAGRKFYEWEMKGVPLRVEIGPRDLEKDNVVIVRRDNAEKMFVPRCDALATISRLLDATIPETLSAANKERLAPFVTSCGDLDALIDLVEAKRGLVRIPMCNSEECAEIVEKTAGVKILGIPEEFLPALGTPEVVEVNCVACGRPVNYLMVVGKSY